MNKKLLKIYIIGNYADFMEYDLQIIILKLRGNIFKV